jgi:hypothetical protein
VTHAEAILPVERQADAPPNLRTDTSVWLALYGVLPSSSSLEFDVSVTVACESNNERIHEYTGMTACRCGAELGMTWFEVER